MCRAGKAPARCHWHVLPLSDTAQHLSRNCDVLKFAAEVRHEFIEIEPKPRIPSSRRGA